MAFTPPSSPVTNQIYSDGSGKNWQWNGTQWEPFNPPLGIAAITAASTINAGSASSTYNGPLVISNVQPAFKTVNNSTILGTGNVPITNVQTFDSSGTWTAPTGMASTSRVLIQCWGGGGSGGKGTSATIPGAPGAGGGGGGGYNYRWASLSELTSTVTVTIGAGGVAVTTAQTSGNIGGTTTFGSYVSAYGGAEGFSSGGGGGGGQTYAGSSSNPGGPGFTLVAPAYGIYSEGAGGVTNAGYTGTSGLYKGGGGGAQNYTGTCCAFVANQGGPGGASVWGGGGGGAANNTATLTGVSGGISNYGGSGGRGAFNTSAASGTVPSGGGGGTLTGASSGAGASGRVIVTVFAN